MFPSRGAKGAIHVNASGSGRALYQAVLDLDRLVDLGVCVFATAAHVAQTPSHRGTGVDIEHHGLEHDSRKSRSQRRNRIQSQETDHGERFRSRFAGGGERKGIFQEALLSCTTETSLKIRPPRAGDRCITVLTALCLSAVKSRGHAPTSLSLALDGHAAASAGLREKASASAWAYFRLGAAITVPALIRALVALAMRQSFR